MRDWCAEIEQYFREMDAKRRFGRPQPDPMDPIVEKVRKAITDAFAGAKPVPAKLKRKPTMRNPQDRDLALQCLSLSLGRSASSGGYETSVVIEEAAEFFAFVTGEPAKSVREQIEGLLDTAEVK